MSNRIETFTNEALRFPVVDTGPLDGVPVLLLHGWPQDQESWAQVARRLNDAGYRTFAPGLRGTSEAANPPERSSFGASRLRDDVTAMVRQIGQPVHLVGHDWGAALAWDVATHHPDLLRSMTAVSVPHRAAFLRSLLTSTQGVSSWYMYFFQLPWLPELSLRSTWFMTRALTMTGQRPELAARDARRNQPHSLRRGGLNWYRGMLTELPDFGSPTPVPVLQVWSDGDTAVRRDGIDRASAHAAGTYRLAVLEGVSHWVPEEAPDALTDELITHFTDADGQSA